MQKFKFLFVIMCATNMFAQDVIITNYDNMLRVYNVEIGKNAIFYQAEDNEDAPIQKIAKSEVFIIKKADGTKIDPNETESVNAPVTVAGIVSDEVSLNAEEVAFKNKELMDEWNSIRFEVQIEKKNLSAKHNVPLVKLGIKKTSQLTDGNIQVHYSIDSNKFVKFGNTVSITVENKTDRIVYVDMANSFFTSNRGVKSMYSNRVESKTNANAVGVRLGFIGGASVNAKTTVSTETRMIAIPPKGSIILPYKINSPFVKAVYFGGDICYSILSPNENSDNEQLVEASTLLINPLQNMSVTTLEELPMGNSIDFTETDNDIEMYSLISYSFLENGQNLKSVRTDFFLQQILKMGYPQASCSKEKAVGIYNLNPLTTDGVLFIPYDMYYMGKGFYVDYEWYCKK